ncbi:MAG: hypothetical protein R3B45_18345 [Bdellovibrionota bacterium]
MPSPKVSKSKAVKTAVKPKSISKVSVGKAGRDSTTKKVSKKKKKTATIGEKSAPRKIRVNSSKEGELDTSANVDQNMESHEDISINSKVQKVGKLSVMDEQKDDQMIPAVEGDVLSEEDLSADAQKVEKSQITLKLSNTLINRLKITAENEGVSLEDYINELICEGVVLRAWQSFERKSNLRSGGTQGSLRDYKGNGNHNNQKYHNNNVRGAHKFNGNGNRIRNNNNGNSMRRGSGYNVMDDNASFLEYVRSQEKRQR